MAATGPTGLDEPVRPEDVQVEEALTDVDDDEETRARGPLDPRRGERGRRARAARGGARRRGGRAARGVTACRCPAADSPDGPFDAAIPGRHRLQRPGRAGRVLGRGARTARLRRTGPAGGLRRLAGVPRRAGGAAAAVERRLRAGVRRAAADLLPAGRGAEDGEEPCAPRPPRRWWPRRARRGAAPAGRRGGGPPRGARGAAGRGAHRDGRALGGDARPRGQRVLR